MALDQTMRLSSTQSPLGLIPETPVSFSIYFLSMRVELATLIVAPPVPFHLISQPISPPLTHPQDISVDVVLVVEEEPPEAVAEMHLLVAVPISSTRDPRTQTPTRNQHVKSVTKLATQRSNATIDLTMHSNMNHQTPSLQISPLNSPFLTLLSIR